MGDPQEPAAVSARPAERMKFFTDAVVAIAMTLLILPLMESVAEAGRDGVSTADYLHEHGGQLFSFALSFVIIASFWAGHHSLFEHVERYTVRLLWLNIAWMFTIVWLPVPTAMIGSMAEDGPQKAVYIGTLLVSSAVMVVINLVLLRSPDLWVPGYPLGPRRPHCGDRADAALRRGAAPRAARARGRLLPDVRAVPDWPAPGPAVPPAEAPSGAAIPWLSASVGESAATSDVSDLSDRAAAAVRQEYQAFALGQAAGVSPTYEALALAVAEHEVVTALLAPSLLDGLVEGKPTQPRREGPESFLTALDGIPVGWCGPHGQFCD